MALFTKSGTRITKSTFPTTAIPAAHLPKVLSEDLIETRNYGRNDPKPEGSTRHLGMTAGTVLTQQQIDNLFPPAKVHDVSPAVGPAAGGTRVTIVGENLDGVTAVTFGGTAGTSLTVTSDRELKVTTPAKAAGAANVVVTNDAGPTTRVGGFTFE